MNAPATTRRDRKAAYTIRDKLTLILGPRTCPTCLERYGSQLHRELCEVS